VKIRATAVDLFCGAGGLTRGLLDAGVNVAAGYDIDDSCRFPYEHNNRGARFHDESVTALTASDLAPHYPEGHARILVGCAPCQTFSKYTQGLENVRDPKWTLLRDFGRLVRGLKPDIVSMENVPELQRHKIFREFLSVLASEGFHFTKDPEKRLVYCPDYGIPQHRRRLVIVASRLGPIELVPPTHRPGEYRHGWRLPAWEHKLSDFWRVKLRENRKRDRRNFRRLRAAGWTVIRLWEHGLRADSRYCIDRIRRELESKREAHPGALGRKSADPGAGNIAALRLSV
jgi:site-specific DNA-cytosine methylase